MECLIMQGIPGSGKSAFANDLQLDVCSADDYHNSGGVYRWLPQNAGPAHKFCMQGFLRRMQDGDDVCVDNTNTTLLEMIPYIRIAQARNYDITIHTFICTVDTAVLRNSHNVPRKTIERLARRMQPPPKAWGVTHIIHETD